jgi:endonuclease/exonuclease/phosphatase family metal-dependent hydrolase
MHRLATHGACHDQPQSRKLPCRRPRGGIDAVGCAMAQIRVMSWNVQNLFAASTPDGPPTQAAFDAKLASLVEVIDAQQPDVLALQEIGPPEVLAVLQQRLGHQLPNRELSTHPDRRGIRVAICSHLPLQNPVQLHTFPAGLAPVQVGDPPTDPGAPPATLDHMGRGGLHVTVTADGRQLTVITAHLKSKLLSFPGGRFQPRNEGERARFGAYALALRAAEAVTLRAHLTQLLHDQGATAAVVLAGDLNDAVDAATTQLLQGPPGSELETPGFARPDQGDTQRMWNLALRIPEGQRFTRRFRGRKELIDHIFASKALMDPLPTATTAMAGELRSVTEDPREERGKPGSDHAAVVATFQLPS